MLTCFCFCRCVCVLDKGTTSVRALESMYWFGVRLLVEEGAGARGTIHVGQWEPYERMDELGEDALPTPHQAIQAVLQWHRGRDAPMFGTTQLLVVPEYPFKMYVCEVRAAARQGSFG